MVSFNKKYRFVPYNTEPLPKYSLIHYMNDTFEGGELVIYPNKVIIPKKNMFVLIDSNMIHKVNIQKSGVRIVHLYKFF